MDVAILKNLNLQVHPKTIIKIIIKNMNMKVMNVNVFVKLKNHNNHIVNHVKQNLILVWQILVQEINAVMESAQLIQQKMLAQWH